LTDSARRTDSFWLYASLPIESVWPIAITTSRLIALTLFARSSSFALPSGLSTDLSKSNSTSAASVTFSATGAGFGFAGAGAGGGGGGGGGGGTATGAGGFGTRSGSHSMIAIAGVQ
jgi:hypothetical protein